MQRHHHASSINSLIPLCSLKYIFFKIKLCVRKNNDVKKSLIRSNSNDNNIPKSSNSSVQRHDKASLINSLIPLCSLKYNFFKIKLCVKKNNDVKKSPIQSISNNNNIQKSQILPRSAITTLHQSTR